MNITELPAASAACLVPLLEQVHDLHLAHAPQLFHPLPDVQALADYLTEWLARDAFTALIAGPAEHPLAYLVFETEHRPGSILTRPETRMMIHHICVDTDHRRKGIGTALIADVKRRARLIGADRVGASVHAFNTASAALMERSGLRHTVTYFTQELGVE